MPPHILRAMAERAENRAAALETLMATERFRGERHALCDPAWSVPTARRVRALHDAGGSTRLPAPLARGETDGPVHDPAVDEAHAALGTTYDFYDQVLRRNSIDDRGQRLDAVVHFGRRYVDAFWNGRHLVFGDGDGELFGRFTACVEIVAHELTHGVVENEAALAYHGQSGALHESFADVFGCLVKQWSLRQTAAQASWLIGEGVFAGDVEGAALRSLRAPGSAYDDPRLGADPQPAHMRDYVHTDDDHGGVHVNSGIPNRAFYVAATRFGGCAWERAGRIWYHALCTSLTRSSDFADAAAATTASAGRLFGPAAEDVVHQAWAVVGVRPAPPPEDRAPERPKVG